jgi:ankyrin repeat protein
LLKVNGGIYRQGVAFFDSHGLRADGSLGLRELYGLWPYGFWHPGLRQDLSWTTAICERRIPAESIPIADTSINNIICMVVTGSDTGLIFSTNYEGDPVTSLSSATKIAGSFEEFLSGLQFDGEFVDWHELELPFAYAERGDTQRLQEIIEAKQVSVNAFNSANETFLYIAANSRQAEVVELLLKLGADVSIRGRNRRTPLHAAASAGACDCTRLLINSGASINAEDDHGRTPLYDAIERMALDVVLALIKNGAKVIHRSKLDQTPLSLCSDRARKKYIAPMLIAAGA